MPSRADSSSAMSSWSTPLSAPGLVKTVAASATALGVSEFAAGLGRGEPEVAEPRVVGGP